MDKAKQIQRKGNQTAFIVGMIIILLLILLMVYL